MTSPTVRVAEAAASDSAASPFLLSAQAFQHLVVAAFMSEDGASSFEDMRAKRLPLVIDEDRARSGFPDGWSGLLRDDVVYSRAEMALRRAFARQGKCLPTGEELKFLKLRVAEVVTRQVRAHGLSVYTHKLLFSPEFAETGMKVLGAMQVPELPPLVASVAVATGHLPPLPSRDLRGSLDFLASQPLRSWGFRADTFTSWVQTVQPVVVEFPAPNLEAGRLCRRDDIWGGERGHRATLGMGFFLATTHDQLKDRILIVTPLLHYHAAADGTLQPWRVEYLRTQIHLRLVTRLQRSRLEKAISVDGGAARLKVCPASGVIYSEDRADLKLHRLRKRGG